jgi:hypothetical protein
VGSGRENAHRRFLYRPLLTGPGSAQAGGAGLCGGGVEPLSLARLAHSGECRRPLRRPCCILPPEARPPDHSAERPDGGGGQVLVRREPQSGWLQGNQSLAGRCDGAVIALGGVIEPRWIGLAEDNTAVARFASLQRTRRDAPARCPRPGQTLMDASSLDTRRPWQQGDRRERADHGAAVGDVLVSCRSLFLPRSCGNWRLLLCGGRHLAKDPRPAERGPNSNTIVRPA